MYYYAVDIWNQQTDSAHIISSHQPTSLVSDIFGMKHLKCCLFMQTCRRLLQALGGHTIGTKETDWGPLHVDVDQPLGLCSLPTHPPGPGQQLSRHVFFREADMAASPPEGNLLSNWLIPPSAAFKLHSCCSGVPPHHHPTTSAVLFCEWSSTDCLCCRRDWTGTAYLRGCVGLHAAYQTGARHASEILGIGISSEWEERKPPA